MKRFIEPPFSAEYLRSILSYEPETGNWTWAARRNGVTVGARAGTPNREGRRQIRIDGVKYYSARLAWLYMTGQWPSVEVDHRNRDHLDDRWRNLRQATHSQNASNVVRKKPKRPDLPRGVTVHPNGFLAKISIEGKRRYLGLFQHVDDAAMAYVAASAFRSDFLP